MCPCCASTLYTHRSSREIPLACREGKIKNFTGIDSPYEAPLAAEIEIEARRPDGSHVPPQVQADKVVAYLEEHGFIPKAPKLPMYGVTNNFSVLDGLDFLTFGAGI